MRRALPPLALLGACAPTQKSGSFEVAGPVGAVTVMADAGELQIIAEDRDTLSVDRALDGYIEEVVQRNGADVTLSWEGRGDPGVTATLRLPRGAELAVIWGAGPLRAEGLAAPVFVSLSAGALTLDALESPRAEVELGSGEVTLAFAAPPRDLLVTQGDGPVAVEVPAGDYALDLSTRAGEVLVDGVADNPAAEARLAVHVAAGDIALTGVEPVEHETDGE